MTVRRGDPTPALRRIYLTERRIVSVIRPITRHDCGSAARPLRSCLNTIRGREFVPGFSALLWILLTLLATVLFCAFWVGKRLKNVGRSPFEAPTIAQVFLNRGSSAVSDSEFYPYIRLPNSTFKTTSARRMVDADDLLISLLRQGHRGDRGYHILDAATSSGTCTFELYNTCVSRGLSVCMFASDLYMEARLLNFWAIKILYLDTDYILQVDLLNLAFPRISEHAGRLFSIAGSLVRFARKIGVSSRRLLLINRDAEDSPIEFSGGDVFAEVYKSEPERNFDVIRVANLLHTNYFSEEEILSAISNLLSRLRDGGILAIVRSQEDGNRASFFRWQSNKLELLDQLNGGVKITGLVLGTNKDTASI